jgi:hypothetical protein
MKHAGSLVVLCVDLLLCPSPCSLHSQRDCAVATYVGCVAANQTVLRLLSVIYQVRRARTTGAVRCVLHQAWLHFCRRSRTSVCEAGIEAQWLCFAGNPVPLCIETHLCKHLVGILAAAVCVALPAWQLLSLIGLAYCCAAPITCVWVWQLLCIVGVHAAACVLLPACAAFALFDGGAPSSMPPALLDIQLWRGVCRSMYLLTVLVLHLAAGVSVGSSRDSHRRKCLPVVVGACVYCLRSCLPPLYCSTHQHSSGVFGGTVNVWPA